MDARPLLALTAGDPAGIGPEIVAAVLADPALRARARLLVLGPGDARPANVPPLGRDDDPRRIEHAAWLATTGARDWELGHPQASAGRAALAALRAGHDLACARRVDALVCAPVSKEALHLAGERVEGQSELLARWAGTEVAMLGIAGELRVLLLTRHLPLRTALARVTT